MFRKNNQLSPLRKVLRPQITTCHSADGTQCRQGIQPTLSHIANKLDSFTRIRSLRNDMKKAAFTLAESANARHNGNNHRRCAFTLAETLITLMVIGVVAALTIPSLMQVYKDKQLETATKKAMTTIANGFKLMIANNDGSSEALPLFQCGEDFACLSGVFHKSFQIGLDKSKTHDGLVEKYTKPGDSSEEASFVWDDVPYIFTTNDGMTYGYLGGFDVVVDLNGNKAPNKICKDVIKLSYGNGTVKASKKNDTGEEVGLCEDLNSSLTGSDCGEFVFVGGGEPLHSSECRDEMFNNFEKYVKLCIKTCKPDEYYNLCEAIIGGKTFTFYDEDGTTFFEIDYSNHREFKGFKLTQEQKDGFEYFYCGQ